MKVYLEKCLRIMNDLVAYCHHQGATEYNMHLRHKDNVGYMTITAPLEAMSEHSLHELSESLNLPRQREIEQNYWELSGESDTADDLALIGMMIDHAMVEYDNGALHIQVWRHD